MPDSDDPGEAYFIETSPTESDILVSHGRTVARCLGCCGEVSLDLPTQASETFSFTFTVSGIRTDFMLFPTSPTTATLPPSPDATPFTKELVAQEIPQPTNRFLTNFACFHSQSIILTKAPQYTVHIAKGQIAIGCPAYSPKLESPVWSRCQKRGGKLPLPPNHYAVQEIPEGMRSPSNALLSCPTNPPRLTFRLWSGCVLRLMHRTQSGGYSVRESDELPSCVTPTLESLAASTDVLHLNVGGRLFIVPRGLLLREPDTFFHAMLHRGVWAPDAKGQYCIDRNPNLFVHVLDYLRTGMLNLKGFSQSQIQEVFHEMDFYAINSVMSSARATFNAENLDSDIRLKADRRIAKCVAFQGDVQLHLPPMVGADAHCLLAFHVRGVNPAFVLYSELESGLPFFANFPCPNALEIPALPFYIIKVTPHQVSFLKTDEPPKPDEEPKYSKTAKYAQYVTKPIRERVVMPVVDCKLAFRLWFGAEIHLCP